MRISEIVLRIRNQKEKIKDGNGTIIFSDRVAGAAELDLALRNTLSADMAFVVPLLEDAEVNQQDNFVKQKILQRFGVVVAIANDTSQREKTGIVAFDKLHYVQSGLFKILIGWQPEKAESLVYYRGARMIKVCAAYIYYQFEFEFEARLLPRVISATDPITGIESAHYEYDLLNHEFDYDGVAYEWNTIYANIIIAPSERLPYTGSLPINDGFPSVSLPQNTAMYIDMRDHPDNGAFSSGFASGYDKYTGD